MHLREMMTTRASTNEDVSKLITTMDSIRQQLLNVCPDGTVSVDDIYASSLISALPEDWTSVTAPLELQAAVTPVELKSVLRGHLTKLKNREVSQAVSSSTALSTSTSIKKHRNQSTAPRTECTYCQHKGHLADGCHRKLLNDQKKEIEALKKSMKTKSKSANVAQISDSESADSDDCKPSAKQTSSSRVKFSRAAKKSTITNPDHMTYNAD